MAETKRKLILVAEDYDSNYQLIDIVLGSEYSVSRAMDGNEVIRKVKIEVPDLIFMDIKMPELDGLTATRILRENGYSMPIVALTAYSFEEDRDKALEAGCNCFITKPVLPKKLRSIVAEYL